MARSRPDLPHDFPDKAIRDALVTARNLRALLREVAPAVADRLDYGRMEVVKPAYLLDDWRKRDNDVMVRLPFRDAPEGGEILVCVLVEHQSTADPVMPLRMLVYAVLYWEQEWKAWEDGHRRGTPLRLTPVLPVVLHTGAERWDANRSLADLFDVPDLLKDWLPRWAMPLWDLPEHPAEDLLRSPEALWQALAVARAERAPTADFLQVMTEALRRLEPLGTQEPVYWHQLLRLVLYWSLFRRPRPEHAQLIDAARQSQTNVQLLEEVKTMSQQMWKTYEEEVFERGLSQGEERAELRVHREILRSLLEARFQTLPGPLLERIAAADLDQLKAALAQVVKVQSLDELKL